MSFKDLGTSSVSNDSIATVTDGNGQVQLQFDAPAWGGQVLIRARTDIGGTTAEASDTLNVRVPGLQMLPFSGAYVKLGGNGIHPGPDDNWQGGDFNYTPDYNHWATAETISLLLQINDSWDVSGQSPLWINDMSLTNGSQFDECGNWNRPHRFHRVGRDVDVRTQKLLAPRLGILVQGRNWKDEQGTLHRNRKNIDFQAVVEDLGGSPEPQVHSPGTDADTTNGNEHYHLYFYGN